MARKSPAGELVIPPRVFDDPDAVEMLRAWIADGKLHCSLNVGLWDKMPEVEEDLTWGKMLADIVRLLAQGIKDNKGADTGETIRRLRKVFDAELDEPTSRVRGKFIK